MSWSSLAPAPWNPWRAIRALVDVTVRWERRDDELGSWDEDSRILRFDPDQSQVERRCTAAHELVHVERGDRTCDPRVHREAARRLIDVRALGEALATYDLDLPQVADELWVDDNTLQTRLDHLHPAERHYLRRRLDAKEHTA